MNTNPTVSRFADLAKITIQPNTAAKAEEEKADFKFSVISRGHFACTHGKDTHIIIDKDGMIGCSCSDMTYRGTNNAACKHIAAFLDLDVPPQKPASGELAKKLMLMGWVGGKDNLHPAELLKPAQNTASEQPAGGLASVVCPHCKTRAKRKTQEEADAWLDNHLTKCKKNPDNESPRDEQKNTPPSDPLYEPEDPAYPEQAIPELPSPPSEDYSSCINAGAERPQSSTDIPSNLATAICNMQKIDLLAVTDSENPFHNAKYADLASVWAAIRKPLTDNGLAVIQTTEQYQDGITVVTTLVHTSGETFASRLSCEVPKSKPDKNGQIKPNIQGLGSTITYLRRYSLTAMVGVAPIDDDGEAAMGRPR